MKFEAIENWVGQSEVVRWAKRILNNVVEGACIPFSPVQFAGPAGLGKTSFVEMFASEMAKATGDLFKLVMVNSGISIPDFITLYTNFIHDKDVIVFIDEDHALSPKMGNHILKPLLESQRQIKTVRYQDYEIEYNPQRQLWIGASNVEPKDVALFGPTGRFRTLHFTPYTIDEVKAIINQKVTKWGNKMKMHQDAVAYLANRVLPNGRAICDLIEGHCLERKGLFDLKRVKALVAEEGYFPRGLRVNDIRTLRFLDSKGKQVNEIAACCNEDSKETSYRLQWLAGYGFVNTNNGKKYLAPAGHEYLLAIVEAQRKAKAKKTTTTERTTTTAQAAPVAARS